MDLFSEVGKSLESASTLPSQCYTSGAICEAERTHVFHASWQFAARSAQLRHSGDFVTTEIAGEPVLVVRDKSGQLHALANVCRHRAARVECRAEGHATRFRCRYHGWAYDLAGRLAGTPDFDGVDQFDRTECPLPRYAVMEAEPFVFVHLGVNPPPFLSVMQPMLDSLKGTGADVLQFHSRKSWTIDCNWKVFVDNYQDGGYHIPTLHPELAKVVDMDGYQVELFPYSSLQRSPLHQRSSLRQGEAALYWWVYPNFMVNLYDGVMDVNIVHPLGQNRCHVIFDYYFAAGTTDDYIRQSIDVADQVQNEDIDICQEVQRGLHSRQYQSGRFSVRREAGAHLFHQLIASALRTTHS